MAAYEIPNLRFSGEAAGAIKRRRFVKINNAEKVVQAASNKDVVIGVSSQPCEKAGEVAEIYDGIVIVEAGAAVASGIQVMCDAEGRAVPYVAAADVVAVGKSVTKAGALGEMVSIKIY